jgi:GMP synthase-like glutamine amidotransferase
LLGYNAFDDVSWINKLVDFTAKVLAHDRVRALGVCFGHQIIGRALGVKVRPNKAGWEVAISEVNLTGEGKELFGVETLVLNSLPVVYCPRKYPITFKQRIYQMHRDIVYYYPPGIIPLGSSPRCEVQGMYAPGRFVTVQGHPELNEEIVAKILGLRHKNGTISDGVYEEAMTRVGNEHDGMEVGKAFVKFLVEAVLAKYYSNSIREVPDSNIRVFGGFFQSIRILFANICTEISNRTSVGHRILRYYPRGWARWVPTQFDTARVGTLFFPEYSSTRE